MCTPVYNKGHASMGGGFGLVKVLFVITKICTGGHNMKFILLLQKSKTRLITYRRNTEVTRLLDYNLCFPT